MTASGGPTGGWLRLACRSNLADGGYSRCTYPRRTRSPCRLRPRRPAKRTRPPPRCRPRRRIPDKQAVICRIVSLRVSATYTSPALSAASPKGRQNCALEAAPSVDPHTSVPARVVTTPVGVISRMTLLKLSATYTLPAASVPIPCGSQNRAAEPVPFAYPGTPAMPARVVTDPAA